MFRQVDAGDGARPGDPAGGLKARRARIRQRGDYQRLVLITALFGAAAGSYPVTVLSASLPRIADDLGAADSTITWVIAAPLLAFAVVTPIIGKVGDLYGHRRTYLVSFALGTVLAFATALAWDTTSLIVLRTVAQAAKAAAGPSAMAMILSTFPRRERTRALGTWAVVVALSPALGVVTGGPLIEWIGWRALFVVQGTTVLIALVGALFIVPETPRRTGIRFDLPGAVTHGVLWSLTLRHITELDRYEAVVEGMYHKTSLIVQKAGDPVEALVYIDPVCELGQPKPGYLQTILDGAANFALPTEYIADLARDWGEANATSGPRE